MHLHLDLAPPEPRGRFAARAHQPQLIQRRRAQVVQQPPDVLHCRLRLHLEFLYQPRRRGRGRARPPPTA
jgi:hypothetical protein